MQSQPKQRKYHRFPMRKWELKDLAEDILVALGIVLVIAVICALFFFWCRATMGY